MQKGISILLLLGIIILNSATAQLLGGATEAEPDEDVDVFIR